jgi:hypothetical protein
MARCEAAPTRWKNRLAFRISNGTVEITVLFSGGHIADARLCGSPYNALYESPWETIEPHTFSESEHAAQYGLGPVGKFLSGYTGHAFVLGYFGMPNEEEAAAGLPLHGEASTAEWKVLDSHADELGAFVTLEVLLPYYQLRASRTLYLTAGASSVLVEERVTNIGKDPLDFQWVEHATFGEPLFTNGEARLFLSATQGKTWPLGYEGHALLPSDLEFRWPALPALSGEAVDLSEAFPRPGTGFVASLVMEHSRSSGFIAIHNRRLELAVGYVFDPRTFPWVALWEENCARDYAPWNGVTRARGVEFGTSPMPLGLKHASEMRTLFDIPVLASISPAATMVTTYHLFITELSSGWSGIEDVTVDSRSLVLHDKSNQTLAIPASTLVSAPAKRS